MKRRARAALLLFAMLGCSAALAASPRLRVDIDGIEDQQIENVRAFLSVLRYRDDADLSDALVERLHGRAEAEIRAALKPFGYYHPRIEATLEHDERGWQARYRIDPGQPVRFVAFDVALDGPGRDDPAFEAAIGEGSPEIGDIARHDRYDALKERILTAAEDSGYLEGAFTANELAVDPVAGTARIRLTFNTGVKLLFGTITFDQDVVDDSLIERYVEFERGAAFSLRKLLDLQYALSDSDYFQLVEVDPQRDAIGVDREVPVTVHMTPNERHRWAFGLGYATDTGPRGSIDWEDRRVNAAGHRARTDLEYSEIKRELGVTYQIPLAKPAAERLALRTALTEEDVGDAISQRAELGASIVKTWRRYRQITYLNFEGERSLFPGAPDRVTHLLIPGAGISHTTTDSPLYTRNGRRWNADVHGSPLGALSDVSFLQYSLSGKLVHSFGATRLLVRAEYARTLLAELGALPSSQRLFAGGDQSVRGYGYESIGEVDADGNVIGGTELATASIEVDRLFTKSWGAALFVDAGDAVDGGRLDPKVGAGIGLRWVSPIGMLRFDIAWPLEPGLDDWHIHFSIGPDL